MFFNKIHDKKEEVLLLESICFIPVFAFALSKLKMFKSLLNCLSSLVKDISSLWLESIMYIYIYIKPQYAGIQTQ